MYRTLCFNNTNARWNKINRLNSSWALYVLFFKLPFSVVLYCTGEYKSMLFLEIQLKWLIPCTK